MLIFLPSGRKRETLSKIAGPYTSLELMICAASKLLEDHKSVLVGTGLPVLSAMLAKRTHAPNLLLIFEAGGIGPQLVSLPISVGDSATTHASVMASSMDWVMSMAQQGYVDYGFLGAAQIDPYGNINTTVVGEYARPRVRLPGSGGANDVGSLCWRTIVIMNHDKQKFVPKLDFLTTPGYISGPGIREAKGLPEGTGPYRVVTQLGVFGFDEETRRMRVLTLHPGVDRDLVAANTGFEIPMGENISNTDLPTEEELRLLREEIDPDGLVIR